MNKREVGTGYEKEACAYLRREGYDIITVNYRKKIGEIDVIARDGCTLVFVEVKYRKSMAQGGAFYAIGPKKQQTIRRVAQWYLAEKRIPQGTQCRFDAVLIDGEEITHVINAW